MAVDKEAPKEVLSTLSSMKQARRMLDEIASGGGWKLTVVGDEVIYKKGAERMGIERKGDRQYQTIKWSEDTVSGNI
jgi:hypothetical protein